MRKLIAALAILVSSFGFICMAGASPAMASNCNVTATAISWTGTLTYTHEAHNCTDVDLVEFSPLLNGTGAIVVGIVDTSVVGTPTHFVAVPPTVVDVLCGRQYTSLTVACDWTGHVWSWCNPHVNHVVYSTSQFRIHSKTNQTWGPWHGVASTPNEVITC